MRAHTQTLQPEMLEAIAALQQLAELFLQRRERLAQSVGLSVEQWRVLQEIGGESFMPSLFARKRRCSAAAVSKTIRHLLEKGAIVVEISPRDGRQRTYRLTPRGRALLARLRRARQRAIWRVWSEFSPSELKQFAQFSRELSRRLEAYDQEERAAIASRNGRTETQRTQSARMRKA